VSFRYKYLFIKPKTVNGRCIYTLQAQGKRQHTGIGGGKFHIY